MEQTPAAVEMNNRDINKRLCELDGLVQQQTAQLEAIKAIRARTAAQMAFAPPPNDWPETEHQRIARIVPVATDISWDCIKGKQRNQKVVNARWLAIEMLAESKYSCAQIGRFLNRDHTTILHARKGWAKLYAGNVDFQIVARAAWWQFYRERL